MSNDEFGAIFVDRGLIDASVTDFPVFDGFFDQMSLVWWHFVHFNSNKIMRLMSYENLIYI